MSMLGRYYQESNKFVTDNFIDTIALEAQNLYTKFKAILS